MIRWEIKDNDGIVVSEGSSEGVPFSFNYNFPNNYDEDELNYRIRVYGDGYNEKTIDYKIIQCSCCDSLDIEDGDVPSSGITKIVGHIDPICVSKLSFELDDDCDDCSWITYDVSDNGDISFTFMPNHAYLRECNVTAMIDGEECNTYYFEQDSDYSMDYVEIGGIKWAINNLGASSPYEVGLLYSWGDIEGCETENVGCGTSSEFTGCTGEDKRYFGWDDYRFGNGTHSITTSVMSKYNSSDGKKRLDNEDDAAYVATNGAWRMPTEADYQTLVSNTTHTHVDNFDGMGVKGVLFTDKNDCSKKLFFMDCGQAENSEYPHSSYTGGAAYWNSTLNFNIKMGSIFMENAEGTKECISQISRGYGLPIRPILNE